MIWLGLGTALLAWAAAGKRPADWITWVCVGLVASGAALALRLYHDVAVALIVAGAIAAAFTGRHFGLRPAPPLRWAALAVGLAAIAFALFGPAQGLF